MKKRFTNYQLLPNKTEAEHETYDFVNFQYSAKANASWTNLKHTVMNQVVLANMGSSSTQVGLSNNAGEIFSSCESDLGAMKIAKEGFFKDIFGKLLKDLFAKDPKRRQRSTLLLFNA